MKNSIEMHGTGLPLVEPDAVCEACAAQGTVGRAVRFEEDGSIRDLIRFCEACWPEQSARFAARWDEEHRLATDAWERAQVLNDWPRLTPLEEPQSRWTAFESATWHGVLMLVTDALAMERIRERDGEPSRDEYMRNLASQISAYAPFRVGPMPFTIERFLMQYAVPN